MGEPRGKIKHDSDADMEKLGDCIDCNLCVAVCPTGIDIRNGQQEGCITCGLCIDACDSVMDKVGRPKKLISYVSLKELIGQKQRPFYKRARFLIYTVIIVSLSVSIFWGILHISPLSLTVIRERQPLYVRLSNGDIQNKYTLKISNKSNSDISIIVRVTGLEEVDVELKPAEIVVNAGKLKQVIALVRLHENNIENGRVTTFFEVESMKNKDIRDIYETVFIGPKSDRD